MTSPFDDYRDRLDLAWSEDDATVRLSDHVGLSDGLRLFGRSEAEVQRARNLGRCFDAGDADLYELDDGAVVVSSYPGASAIWLPRPRIVAAAIRVLSPGASGLTLSEPPPVRHPDLLRLLGAWGPVRTHDSPHPLQCLGFFTSWGRFVDRARAATIARRAGQVPERKRTDPQHELFTEDLW